MSLVHGTLVPMLGLSLCDGCRDGGLDNQVATIITKVPSNTQFLRQKCLRKKSHALTNCTRGRCTAKLEYNGSAQCENPASLRLAYRHKIAPRDLLAWRTARCAGVTSFYARFQGKLGINLLGQNFQPCSWTRCFNSEEPSHECSGPPGVISC